VLKVQTREHERRWLSSHRARAGSRSIPGAIAARTVPIVLWCAVGCLPALQGATESGTVSPGAPRVGEELELLRRDGAAYNAAGMFVEGELRWSKALLLLRAQSSPPPALLIDVLQGLSVSYRGAGRAARSREVAEEALRWLEPGAAADDALIWRLERAIGDSYAVERQWALAIASYGQALAAAARHPDELRENVIATQMDLSAVLARVGDDSSATSSAEEALRVARQAGKRDRVTHDAILNLVATYVNVGRWDAAQQLLDEERGVLRVWRPRSARPENAPLDEGVLRPRARGRVVGSGEVGVRLSDAWAYCAYKFRGARAASAATARLTTVLGPDGSVSEVTLTAFGLDERAADCMVLEAAATQFPAPEGDGAVIVFATETFAGP